MKVNFLSSSFSLLIYCKNIEGEKKKKNWKPYKMVKFNYTDITTLLRSTIKRNRLANSHYCFTK